MGAYLLILEQNLRPAFSAMSSFVKTYAFLCHSRIKSLLDQLHNGLPEAEKATIEAGVVEATIEVEVEHMLVGVGEVDEDVDEGARVRVRVRVEANVTDVDNRAILRTTAQIGRMLPYST